MNVTQNFTIDYSSFQNKERPVFCHYSGQLQPQPAFVQIDEDGRVWAGYCPDIGNGVPMSVWYRHDLRVSINPELSSGEIECFLLDTKIQALLERIVAGHDIEWDGSNWIGSLTGDARAALDALTVAAEELTPEQGVIGAADFLFGAGASVLDAWDGVEPIEAAVARQKEAAKDCGAYIVDDVREAIIEQIKSEIWGHTPGLTADHLKAVVDAGVCSQSDVDEYLEEQND